MEPASSPARPATWQLLAFAVLVGLLAAATSGYGYGRGASAIHLTEILRTLDADFLPNDFYLEAQDAFGPRFYYRLAFAAAACVVPLWLVFAAAYVLAAIATSLATALAARDLAGSTLAAVVATPLVMWTLPYDSLASWPAIYNASGGTEWTKPALLAEPLCLLALWRGIRGRPMQAAAISALAILLHPTMGLGSAAVALAAASVRVLRGQEYRRARSRGAVALGGAVGVVAVVVVGCWIVPGVLSGAIFALDGGEVVRLVAYVKHPMHLVPSTWATETFLRPAVFWGAGVLALAGFRWRFPAGESAAEDAATMAAIAVALAAVGCGFACGWFFVEVVPRRWAATVQFYRLQPLVSWLCWIVLAAAVADALRQGWLSLRSCLPARATRLIASHGGPALRRVAIVCLAALAAAMAIGVGLRRAQAWPDSPLAVRLAGIFSNVPQPIFTLREPRPWTRPALAELAAVARRGTPPDAVFLVPRDWLEWRLLAQRAAVVDRAFPFREDRMQAWHERYVAVFDLEHGAGYPFHATKCRLEELAQTYRIDYAVVPSDSCLPWRTVAASGYWKLVAVATPSSAHRS